MTETESRALVAILAAAFPREAIEQETFDLYAAAFTRFGSPEAATKAIEAVVFSSKHFPTIAEVRDVYGNYHLRELEAAEKNDRLAIEPVSSGPRVVPDVALRTLERLSEKSAAAKPREAYIEAGLADLPWAGRGVCDDCAKDKKLDEVERWTFGSFSLCRKCATSRLRVAAAA